MSAYTIRVPSYYKIPSGLTAASYLLLCLSAGAHIYYCFYVCRSAAAYASGCDDVSRSYPTVCLLLAARQERGGMSRSGGGQGAQCSSNVTE